jgi:hypothetical protein
MWSLTHALQLAQKIRLDQAEKFIPLIGRQVW